ncbi:MAG: HD domain-containing protein [Eubacterium sp.]|nr:HD domain-containing protein [Eubacterium sp.]
MRDKNSTRYQIYQILSRLEHEGNLTEEKKIPQHRNVSVHTHSVHVALTSCRIADRLHLDVDRDSLIRGALLHDYFLYNWREYDRSHRLHGFRHPGIALRNAKNDYSINEVEEDIIKKHMFPLTPLPPATREAWIVTLADKICAVKELVGRSSKYSFSGVLPEEEAV